ncbi:MAG: DnaJ domain-containing protein [Thermoproteota archaeon]
MADSKGYYAILGVPERATQLEIKKAYRRLARKYHPDRNNGSAQAEDMIKKVNAAYEVLSDIHRRAQYDRDGIGFGDTGSGQQHEEQEEEERHEQAHHHYQQHHHHEEQQERTRAERLRARKEAAAEQQQQQQQYYAGPTAIETPKSRFHIIVEPSLCMAFGSCETLAPKVFVVEKNKRVNPKARVESELGADLDTIYAAAQTCPTKAIKIIDRFTGEQIFP